MTTVGYGDIFPVSKSFWTYLGVAQITIISAAGIFLFIKATGFSGEAECLPTVPKGSILKDLIILSTYFFF